MMQVKSMDQVVKQLHTEMAQKMDSGILEQLNEFISRGIIVVQTTQPILVREQDSAQVTIRQQVRLVLKDQEYVEKLEKENTRLQAAVDAIERAIVERHK